MRRRTAATCGAGLLAAADVAVVMAPSVVLALAARKGGLPGTHGLDLLLTSAVISAVHARVVWGRLRDEVTHAGRIKDVWIAAFDSLVVLALGTTLLLLLILGGFAETHATLINQGWPVLGLWIGVQLLAVTLAEIAGRAVFRYLEPCADLAGPECDDEPAEAEPETVGA